MNTIFIGKFESMTLSLWKYSRDMDMVMFSFIHVLYLYKAINKSVYQYQISALTASQFYHRVVPKPSRCYEVCFTAKRDARAPSGFPPFFSEGTAKGNN